MGRAVGAYSRLLRRGLCPEAGMEQAFGPSFGWTGIYSVPDKALATRGASNLRGGSAFEHDANAAGDVVLVLGVRL
jgi:hypothetical protein